jgi:oxygen-independent coproporphyrinogen-3 oxidase
MPSTLPEGEVAPADGALPAEALAEAAGRPFGFYLHVPFCAARCGYCDFNTYTATELGGGGSQATYARTAVEEIRLARRVLGDAVDRPVDTVFFGGGTPTLLPADDLALMLSAVRDEFGLATDAEVTTEANPESVDPGSLARLRAAGVNRVSFGMQSAAPHVLRVLDRLHSPGRALEAVGEATAAGFEHVNLDLIYGTPGESLDDWRTSLESALSARPDHVSAYALIVEEGTPAGPAGPRGELPRADDDDLADKYLLADDVLTGAGSSWYEVSNWARPTRHAAGTTSCTGRGDTWWGDRPGRAQSRRRCPLVERQAPLRVRRRAAGGGEPRVRARAAGRRDPPGGTGPAGDPAPGRPGPRRARPARPTGCRGGPSTGLLVTTGDGSF